MKEKSFFQKTKIQIAIGTLLVAGAEIILVKYVSPETAELIKPLIILTVATGLSLIGTHTATDIANLIKKK